MEEILRLCSLEEGGMVCLSVRTGWDLLLGALGLREGDEVLVSAVTHPDMVRIARCHGLRVVPVDLDPRTLSPKMGCLEAALTPRTRAVLVAHLFGGRVEMGRIVRFARENGLLLIEDCAQAYGGPGRMGDLRADASMYSFGTLKTATALGGAVLRVGDPAVLRRMREKESGFAPQRRREYLKKLFQVLCLLLLSLSRPYAVLVGVANRFGVDLDGMINACVRAFPAGGREAELFRRIRRRPSAPLLALLVRRMERFDGGRLAARAAAGERVAGALRSGIEQPGRLVPGRTHWLFPVVVSEPNGLIRRLRGRGFDASRATSSIVAVDPPDGASPPEEAARMMSGIVFLPVYPEMPDAALDELALIVNQEVGERSVEGVTA